MLIPDQTKKDGDLNFDKDTPRICPTTSFSFFEKSQSKGVSLKNCHVAGISAHFFDRLIII